MEPDAAFVWQSESCNLTQECKEQKSRKAEKPGGSGTCSQAAKTCQHSWPESEEDLVSFRPFFTKGSEYKGVRTVPLTVNSRAIFNRCTSGQIFSQNLDNKSKPVDKKCPKALMLSTWKGEGKKSAQTFSMFLPSKTWLYCSVSKKQNIQKQLEIYK